jgi:hypothetical protein
MPKHVVCLAALVSNTHTGVAACVVALYRVFQEESAVLRKNVLYVKLHRYNQENLYPKLLRCCDNGEINFKELVPLNVYVLPNAY